MWDQELVELLNKARVSVSDEMVYENILLRSLADDQQNAITHLVEIVKKLIEAKQIDTILDEKLKEYDINIDWEPIVTH